MWSARQAFMRGMVSVCLGLCVINIANWPRHNTSLLVGQSDNPKLIAYQRNNSELLVIQSVNVSRLQRVSDGYKEKWLEAAIVNPHPFSAIISPTDLCLKPDVFLVIYVHSAPQKYAFRRLIRSTWGNVTRYKDTVRVIFVLGLSTDEKFNQSKIESESKEHNDILQEDFVDIYQNLSYKAVAALKWIGNNCKQAKFVLKVDDDIMVNLFQWLPVLHTYNTTLEKSFFLCYVMINNPVYRKGKWSVATKDWPYTSFPNYCSGSAFTMSMALVVRLHAMSYFSRFLWVDDVYMTGVLPLQLGNVEHVQKEEHYCCFSRSSRNTSEDLIYKYTFSHVYQRVLKAVWEKVVQNETYPYFSKDGNVVVQYNKATKLSLRTFYIISFVTMTRLSMLLFT